MLEYPKVLYLDYDDYLIVANAEEEQAVRDKKYVDFYDLPEHKSVVVPDDSLVPLEQFDSLAAHAAALEDEVTALKAALDVANNKIAELDALLYGQSTAPPAEDYNKMTNDQLRDLITAAGKSAPMRATKDELINILTT